MFGVILFTDLLCKNCKKFHPLTLFLWTQDKFLACLESHQLDIDTSDLALSTLSRVSKFAARTRIKVPDINKALCLLKIQYFVSEL